MSSNILIDKLLSNLPQLDDYSLKLLSKIGNDTGPVPINSSGTDSSSILCDTFSELYLILKPLKDQYSKRNDSQLSTSLKTIRLSKKTAKKVSQLLKPFDDGLIDSTNPDLLQLQKIILMYALIILLIITNEVLLSNTLPLVDDLYYYDSILSSNRNQAIYALQSLPVNIAKYIKTLYHEVIVKNLRFNEATLLETVNIPSWLPKDAETHYLRLIKWVKLVIESASVNIRELLMSPTSFLVDKNRKATSKARLFISSIIGFPLYYSSLEIKDKRSDVSKLQYENTAKLGFLLSELPSFKLDTDSDLDFNIIPRLEAILKTGDDDGFEFSTLQSIPLNLQESFKRLSVISAESLHNYQKSLQLKRVELQQPTNLFKYWIPFLCVAYFGPGLFFDFINNRTEIYNWIRLNLIETTVGFWKNWIVEPFNNILKTIRHDDNSRIAIMSQQSLNSDLESLERMVLEYSLDNYSYITNSTLTETSQQMLQTIKEEIKSGNLELLMKGYENDLRKPIKSLITGDMIRNLLIQIHKTKVDGSLAVSGIDKILKSQELVFGIVAASPSLLIVWYLLFSFKNYLKTGYFVKFTKRSKVELTKSLNNYERLVILQIDQANDGGKVDYYNQGLLYLELISLRRLGLKIMPSFIKSDWIRDLNDLSKSNSNEFRLMTVQRIWNTYGKYLRV